MKKLLYIPLSLVLLCSIFLSIVNTITVKADTAEYLRIIDDTTPFYSAITDTEPLFYLPYTYYVKVLDKDQAFAHVECRASAISPAIDGFVPIGMLFSDGLTVEEPYVNVKIRSLCTSILFEESTLTTPLQYVFAERDLTYFGKYINKSGINVYYVSYNNRLGYVKESDVYPFAINNHPNQLTFITPEEPLPDSPTTPSTEPTQEKDLLGMKIIILACLILGGLVALIFALKSKPKQYVASNVYDENEFE